MTDEQRKALTEYLGECWDADKRPGGDLPNRTFTTDADMMALFRKTVDLNQYPAPQVFEYSYVFLAKNGLVDI